ncbi:hypothetical protein RB2654_15155 [Rhodobacterales bacterium HTCC2654]|uniref:Uncharacterized protein n=1 Tax=Maritimibacter alkaliphilus HTCC2654 TaxID=314271 RepID=A3VH80_9RHOB|nr:hypothetical protein RB2654_15155 [Rhodobacterales bacterium HTCC2654] [Maritimibacter alkaliphilus HTCC2654]
MAAMLASACSICSRKPPSTKTFCASQPICPPMCSVPSGISIPFA